MIKDHRKQVALLMSLCLAGTLPGSAAEQPAWESYHSEGRKAYQQGRYDAACKMLRNALQEAESSPAPVDKARLATIVNDLAFAHLMIGQIAHAETTFQRSLALCREALGDTHPQVAQAYNNLAGFYFAQGDYLQAEQFFQKACSIWHKLRWPDTEEANTTVKNYLALLRKVGRQLEATRFAAAVEEARSGSKGVDGVPADDGTLWSAYLRAALQAMEKGNDAEAERLIKQSLREAQRMERDGYRVTQSMNALAGLYRDQQKYALSEDLYRQVLSAQERTIGVASDSIMPTLENLASVCAAQGKCADAEGFLRRVLELCENKAEPGNAARVATARTELAQVLWKQGKSGEADTLCQQALSFVENSGDKASSTVLEGLVRLSIDRGDTDSILNLCHRVLAKLETKEAKQSNLCDFTSCMIGKLHAARSNPGEAKRAFQRAIAIYRLHPDTYSQELCDALTGLGLALAEQKRNLEADAVLRDALVQIQSKCPKKGQEELSVLSRLSEIALGMGKFQEAERWLKRELTLRAQHGTTADSAAALLARERLAEALVRQSKFAEAEALLLPLPESYRENGSQSVENKALCLSLLAKAQWQQGKTALAERNYRRTIYELESRLGRDCPQLSPILIGYARMAKESGRSAWAAFLQDRAAELQAKGRTERQRTAGGTAGRQT